ncbi:MAG: hypothetical protein JWO93_2089 [Micrococcaceae bacterium]|nr:hypothetical protein [Micrococcaceae bacterium]
MVAPRVGANVFAHLRARIDSEEPSTPTTITELAPLIGSSMARTFLSVPISPTALARAQGPRSPKRTRRAVLSLRALALHAGREEFPDRARHTDQGHQLRGVRPGPLARRLPIAEPGQPRAPATRDRRLVIRTATGTEPLCSVPTVLAEHLRAVAEGARSLRAGYVWQCQLRQRHYGRRTHLGDPRPPLKRTYRLC